MKKAFSRVAVVGRAHTFGVAETLLLLCKYFARHGVEFITDSDTAKIIPEQKIAIFSRENFSDNAELVVVVGGDGSMLHAAPLAARQNLPVLGVNRGYLGFLTDIHPDGIDKIGPILRGSYCEEERSLLEIEICDENEMARRQDVVLNDVVLSSGSTGKLVEFDVAINGDATCSYRADGLIVATPTGSTAYALSGGGPIVHPCLEALVLVPLSSHNLSSRPIVIKDTSSIVIRVFKSNIASLNLSCDGNTHVAVLPGESVHICRARTKLRLIHPLDYNYYATLRSKLHWESLRN